MKKKTLSGGSLCAVLVIVLLGAGVCHGQYSGNIQGVVTDPAGAAINGATVTLRNAATGFTATTTTSDSGNYRFNSLEPGQYTVTAQEQGFKTTEEALTLETSQTQGINLTLPVGSATEAVTVTTEAPPIDIDETRLQATLPADAVRDLPELNRNLYDILAVTPGVVGTGTRGPGESPGGGADNFGTQTPQISANGRSYTGNLVMVDGMNVTSPVQNGNIILSPIPDAVQESSLQTNSWDAENNLGSSVLIQTTTKSGTNQFHGTGSLLFTNQDLQATQEFVTGSFTPFARKDLVGTFGGPIVKNKTFFFADVEKLWATTPSAVGGIVEFEAPQFVTFAQQNFPNTVGTQVLTLYPPTYDRPNGTVVTAQTYKPFLNAMGVSSCGTPVGSPAVVVPCNLPILDEGNFAASPYYNALQYNFRVDQYFTEKDRLYLSYYNDSFNQEQLAPRAGLQALDIMRNRYGQIDFTHTFNERVLWESSFAFASVGGANGQDADLRVPEIAVNDGSQGFHIGGGWGPGEYRGPLYNWRSVLSMVDGKHTLKFGFDGAHAIEHGDFTPDNVRPNFTFNSLLDLVQDNPVNESVGAYNPLTGNAGTVIFGGQETPFGFFGQDDWKVKSNLSLTLALRWDDYTNHTPWGNSGFQFSSLILGSGSTLAQQVVTAGVHPVSAVFAHPLNNLWSPRIGFAWDPTKTGKWSIRGGIGVYHDWVTLGQTVDQTRNNPPGVISPVFTTGSTGPQPIFALAPSGTYPFDYPLPSIPAGSLNAQGGIVGIQSSVTSLNRNFKAPLAVNYVIGVEHQLPWRLVAGANYSGSLSYDGLNGTDINRCDGCATLTNTGGVIGENITTPNTSFGSIDYVTNSNQSTYNAMILTLRGRAGDRGNFQASYTLSQAKDYPEANTRFDQDANQNIPDPFAYYSYYGDADWDVRNRFSLSGAYTFPGLNEGIGRVLTSGWELTSIAAIQSGTPFWVINNLPLTEGGDYNADGTNYDVPDAPTQNFTGSHSRSQYENGLFTAADFPAPAPGTEGNEKRNIYRNPGFAQVDASVLKNNHIPWLGEQGNLQFRFDFLNVLNHVNLGAVDNFMGDTNFGKVNSALPARQLQLGARVSF